MTAPLTAAQIDALIGQLLDYDYLGETKVKRKLGAKAAAALAQLRDERDVLLAAENSKVGSWIAECDALRARCELAEERMNANARQADEIISGWMRKCDALEARCEAAERDATRYRHMREKDSDLSFMFKIGHDGQPKALMALEMLDAAVDAAIAARRET